MTRTQLIRALKHLVVLVLFGSAVMQMWMLLLLRIGVSALTSLVVGSGVLELLSRRNP